MLEGLKVQRRKLPPRFDERAHPPRHSLLTKKSPTRRETFEIREIFPRATKRKVARTRPFRTIPNSSQRRCPRDFAITREKNNQPGRKVSKFVKIFRDTTEIRKNPRTFERYEFLETRSRNCTKRCSHEFVVKRIPPLCETLRLIRLIV